MTVRASSDPVTPDLVAFRGQARVPMEVELAPKSKSRLDAILQLHLGWIIAGKSHAVIYVCGDEEASNRIERAGKRVGLYESSGHLRIETLDTIKAQTIAAYQQARTSAEPKSGVTASGWSSGCECRFRYVSAGGAPGDPGCRASSN